ncbi:MAG TPA: cytochrome c oxidase subunit 4 [Micromonosporaceae bacterium]
MTLSFRLFLGLGVFLVVATIAYALHAHEYEGLVLSSTVAAGALLIGAYGVALVRRTRTELARAATDAEPAGAGEPHVGPTIWPLAFAVAAIGLVIGAVANPWALVPGGVVFIAASVGWVRDVHHQWREHASGQSATHGAGERVALPTQFGPTSHATPADHAGKTRDAVPTESAADSPSGKGGRDSSGGHDAGDAAASGSAE